MNEFTARKLAEVQAFNIIGGHIADRAGDRFSAASPDVEASLRQAAGHDLTGSIPDDHWEIFDSKSARTVDKLTRMMELYVGDEWDNPVEVLEWCSFYAGAGAAHSALTSTANEDVNAKLTTEARELVEIYQTLLQQVIDALRLEAAKRR